MNDQTSQSFGAIYLAHAAIGVPQNIDATSVLGIDCKLTDAKIQPSSYFENFITSYGQTGSLIAREHANIEQLLLSGTCNNDIKKGDNFQPFFYNLFSSINYKDMN